MARVESPVAGFEGDVVGVSFVDGVGETTDRGALAYFRRHGYVINGVGGRDSRGREMDAREAAVQQVGTKLRDAAVDPDPNDFLPPTNAGHADPHGPAVVSPELHGSQGARPVRPGHVPESQVQEVAETSHLEAVQAKGGETLVDGDVVPAEPQPGPEVELPKKNAGADVWRVFAVSQGMSQEQADGTSRADLIKRYAKEG